jgi:SAM-dependent methyltransferase
MGYAWSKLWMDGLYRAVLPAVPPGARVLDLGCGVGLLGLLLDERRTGDRIHGIEWDAAKASLGRKLAADLTGVDVVPGDLATAPWPDCDVIALLDVLHYFSVEQQRAILAPAAGHLRPEGRLLVRVMDSEAGALSALARLVEKTAVRLGWNQASRVNWRSGSTMIREIEGLGFVLLPGLEARQRVLGNRLLVFERLGSPA